MLTDGERMLLIEDDYDMYIEAFAAFAHDYTQEYIDE